MKKILLTMVGGFALVASAQQVTVTSNSRLLKGVEGPAYYPVLNSTGTQLLFASGDAYGLKIYDFADNVVNRISDEPGAGIDATFNANGDVYYVTQKVGEGNLVYRTGMRFEKATAKSEVVLEAQHGYVRPDVGTSGNGFKGAKKSLAPSKGVGTSVCVQGSKLFITTNGVTKEYTPVESYAGYLWASLSPDGKKVAFFAAGKGIVVTDLNGKVLSMLGKYEMPCWYNNDYLVAQNAKDDGHQFTSSQIMLIKADGSFKTNLTSATSMSMQPTSAAGKIVYTTIDGLLYQMTININE
ncbi:MAG: hypothetical protein Q4E41_04305 [Bacteroidales bacterium]|nr:hypothetical protein [Bacteroidales bacterium]